MTLKIGNSIKELRNQEGITQDRLAEYLGVTAQAVSRWENGMGYPDIELLPSIATFFGISLDDLMGVDLSAAQQDRIVMRLAELSKNGEKDACIREGEEALQRFPSNHCIVVLTASAELSLYLVEKPENRDKQDAVFEKWTPRLKRTIEDCTDWGPLNGAKTLMISVYQAQNRDDEAAKIAGTCPSIYNSQELQLSGCLYDDKRIDFIQKTLPAFAKVLMSVLMRLDHPSKEYSRSKSSPSRKELERLIALWDIIYDSVNAPEKMLNMTYIMLYFRYACACYDEYDDTNAMKYLSIVSESTAKMNNSSEDVMDMRANDGTKAALPSDPKYQLSREETVAHNFSYVIYHGYLKGDMFSRISNEKEYIKICKKFLANAK